MKTVTLRCSDEEYELLSKHCEKKERSLNDVLRELVRLSNQSRRERRGLYPNFPVNQKQRLSYQLHHHPSKHWVVTAGTARVTLDDQTLLLTEGKSIFVPCCTKHRLENPGLVPLVVIEVQCGEYLGEDDIIRFNDDYARV